MLAERPQRCTQGLFSLLRTKLMDAQAIWAEVEGGNSFQQNLGHR